MGVVVESFTESVKQRARAALVRTMGQKGLEIENEIKEEISEPYPPASKPFNPPHGRTYNLHAGIQHVTQESETGVQAIIFSEREGGPPEVPIWLEDGTTRMDKRPIFAPVMQRRQTELPEELPEQYRQNFSSGG